MLDFFSKRRRRQRSFARHVMQLGGKRQHGAVVWEYRIETDLNELLVDLRGAHIHTKLRGADFHAVWCGPSGINRFIKNDYFENLNDFIDYVNNLR